MSFIPENSPECLPERDPASLYGPMGAHIPATPPVDNTENPYMPGSIAYQRWEQETAIARIQHERDTYPQPPKWVGLGPLTKQPNPYKHGTRQYFEWELEYVRNRPYTNPADPGPNPPHATAHATRIIEISISSEDPAIQWSVSSKLRFSDLSSHTQAEAIWTTIEELNARLRSAEPAL
jgi:hypothetical protein